VINIGDKKMQTVAGIAKFYTKDQLLGKQVVVLTNLEPKMIRGIESNGMLLAAEESISSIALLIPDKKVKTGSIIR